MQMVERAGCGRPREDISVNRVDVSGIFYAVSGLHICAHRGIDGQTVCDAFDPSVL
jgi:hypothetical protein